MSVPLKIFIIYARADKVYKDDLLKSLKLLQNQGLIEPWHDSDIKPGDEWDKEIKAQLRAADIILPIISFDFFNSDYIHRVEIVEAFERFDRGEVIVIPIIADSCPWTDYPRLPQLQALPADGKPIDDWVDRKKAMTSIYIGVKRIIEELSKRPKGEFDHIPEEARHLLGLASDEIDPYRALEFCSRAIELEPYYYDAFHLRELIHFDLMEFNAAILDFDAVIKINPLHYPSYRDRADSKIELKQYESAILDLDHSIRIYPEDSSSNCSRGLSKQNLGRYHEALKDYDISIQLDPNLSVAYYNRGLLLHKLRRDQEAILDYNFAIRIDPEYAMAYNNRGVSKKNLGLFVEAKNDFLKCLSIDSNIDLARKNLQQLETKMN